VWVNPGFFLISTVVACLEDASACVTAVATRRSSSSQRQKAHEQKLVTGAVSVLLLLWASALLVLLWASALLVLLWA